MVEVGNHIWRSSGPVPVLKQGHLKPVDQDRVQTAFEIQREIRTFLVSEAAEKPMKCRCCQCCEEITECDGFYGILYILT